MWASFPISSYSFLMFIQRSGTRNKCCCLGVVHGWASLGAYSRIKSSCKNWLTWCGLDIPRRGGRWPRLPFCASAECSPYIHSYYDEIGVAQNLSFVPGHPHLRFYPYPTSFTDNTAWSVAWSYTDDRDGLCLLMQRDSVNNLRQYWRRFMLEVMFLATYGAPNILFDEKNKVN